MPELELLSQSKYCLNDSRQSKHDLAELMRRLRANADRSFWFHLNKGILRFHHLKDFVFYSIYPQCLDHIQTLWESQSIFLPF